MNALKLFFALFILACTPAGNNEVEYQSTSVIIQNINVINIRDGSVSQNQDIIIDGQQISKIIKSTGQQYDAATVIDGTGKFIMPGLAEMHAHIPSPDWGRDIAEETLFLYLSNGVTTIRGMLGHPVHLELRERAATGELLSPRIFSSSPSLNGNTVKTKEEANQKVKEYATAGYDFLKLHPGIKKDVFDEIVRTAKEVGINFSGHVSIDVGVRHAINNNYASIDHVDGFIEGLVPESANVNPNENGFFGYNFTDLTDKSLLEDLIAATVTQKVWVVPTQSLFDRWFSPQSPEELAAEPEMKYMPKSTLEQWVKSKKSLIEADSYSVEKWEKFNATRKQIIKALNDDGFGLLLGSDAPQVFNVPGFSLHHELRGITEAGLTPLEALQTGTINPATFFDMEGEFGEVIEGADADLILLDKNPLQDLKNLMNPTGVIVRGKWLDRKTIDKRLDEIAERCSKI